MKMSKKEGLETLNMLNVPSVELIDPNLLDENSHALKEGLSVRISPKVSTQNNVYLPSIHNQASLGEIRKFIGKYQKDFDIIVHRTVKPEIIGSISKYQLSPEEEKLIIELFRDFHDRANGEIKNRAILPVAGGRIIVSRVRDARKKRRRF